MRILDNRAELKWGNETPVTKGPVGTSKPRLRDPHHTPKRHLTEGGKESNSYDNPKYQIDSRTRGAGVVQRVKYLPCQIAGMQHIEHEE